MEKVFIAGGTGLLGYHAALKFLDKGIKVGAIGLPDEIDLKGWYPKEIDLSFGDLFSMDDNAIEKVLLNKNYECFIYALGPDERYLPDAPAYAFFYEKLVNQCKRICSVAINSGIKRIVVLNSYFAYFDRVYKGKLAKNHPYIKARVEQGNELILLGDELHADVMILELPYIFGTMPKREPIWRKHFLAKFSHLKNIYFPSGGATALIDVEGVGQAIVAAAINGKHANYYQIANANMTFEYMINLMMETTKSKKRFVGIPPFLACLFGKKLIKQNRLLNKEGGLNYAKLMTQIQSKRFTINKDIMKEKLGFEELGYDGGKDVIESIKETIKVCYADYLEKEEN